MRYWRAMADIQPPIFVLDPNGGLIAFDTIGDAEEKVPPSDFAKVAGAWDSGGNPLTFRPNTPAGPPLRLSTKPHALSLREVLVTALDGTGDRNSSVLDDATLVKRAHGRFGLLDDSTVRGSVVMETIQGPLELVSHLPR
jgi:hypothetical protein